MHRAVDDSASPYACTAFHPDGLIVANGMGAVVRVWELKSQTVAATFEGHDAPITSLQFSENGYYLATGAADATVKLWDLRNLKNLHTISPEGGASTPIGAVSFDHSGKFLAVAGAALTVYETKKWGTLASWAEQSARWLPRGSSRLQRR